MVVEDNLDVPLNADIVVPHAEVDDLCKGQRSAEHVGKATSATAITSTLVCSLCFGWKFFTLPLRACSRGSSGEEETSVAPGFAAPSCNRRSSAFHHPGGHQNTDRSPHRRRSSGPCAGGCGAGGTLPRLPPASGYKSTSAAGGQAGTTTVNQCTTIEPRLPYFKVVDVAHLQC